MDNNENQAKGLFARLDGLPAHALVIAGLAFTLLSPLIPSFKLAELASARVASEQAESLIALDLEDLKQTQEKARKQDEERKLAERQQDSSFSTLSPEEIQKKRDEQQKRDDERQKREADRKTAMEQKQEELKKKYDTVELKRALLTAQSSAAGLRWHLALAWLGRLMLLVGLLVLTIQSEGLRQKVLLIVLLVVMFSALSGINLNFMAQGNLGESQPETSAPPQRK
ncbi:MAG: hypothetical protein JST85_16540 [Acidobacteria bacterium]|nr:hypothetical protein [Acidobacteriota bacterium]